MEQNQLPEQPLPLNIAARYLRVSARWLRHEIWCGRLPALVADNAVLVHVPTVARLLAKRARLETQIGDEA